MLKMKVYRVKKMPVPVYSGFVEVYTPEGRFLYRVKSGVDRITRADAMLDARCTAAEMKQEVYA